MFKGVKEFDDYLWDEHLYGTVLCEGAQGFWLDINQGNYPYVTSSTTLPYGACSLGFSTHYIRNIYGATKMYDTRSGIDSEFPETLLENKELLTIIKHGEEYGTTTGRMRKVNWLNLDKLIYAITVTGSNTIVMSKEDVLTKTGLYKLYHNQTLLSFNTIKDIKSYIHNILCNECKCIKEIIFSNKKQLTSL